MSGNSKRDILLPIISKGFKCLREEYGYSQADMLKKMDVLGVNISAALFSKLITGKHASLRSLILVARAIAKIVENELDMQFDENTMEYYKLLSVGWEKKVVKKESASSSLLVYPHGRLRVEEMVNFMSTAQKEIIQVGVRLNTLTNYYTSISASAFTKHVTVLLESGVNIKNYLIDPDSNESRLYFTDRSQRDALENRANDDIKRIIERLISISDSLNDMHLPGRFEIFLYKHIPYSQFLVVDGNLSAGKMLVSPYLYGIKRAHSPVMEISRMTQPELFRTYFESLQSYIDRSRKIN